MVLFLRPESKKSRDSVIWFFSCDRRGTWYKKGDRGGASWHAGGCQAEIGSAAAMSAGALAYLQGADPQTVMHAAALALKNMLGLACDPVGGLVEVPCIKRNSYGAVNAVTSAQLALSGICSAITPDDVIDSMRRIGNQMPASLKETSEGGLATSASAERYEM